MRTLNILKTVSTVVAASVVTVIATTEKAGAISIYLGNGIDQPQIDSSFNFSQDGISLTATGVTNTGARNVYQSILGLGVSDTNNPIDIGTNQIGGTIRVGETLKLAFNQSVKLVSVTFSRVGNNDNFSLLVNGNQFVAADIPGGNILDIDVSKFSFNPSPTGNIFGFTVADNNDDYLVKSVEVEAVPEPITLAGMVMGSGFGGILFKKYKKGAKLSSKSSS
ncbi:PEP-CTERM sorting domain-containing protein [Nostoc sphaeroides]|uniref:PEP-CTERM sorting domain-containing protein n=1 Tax=Nostoc sphaeroides TaxID=446679 RepID=UPI0012698A89|nr:PEP-CTERM sorting domain-containing protein [Nostoc sphaeroides]